MPSASNENMKEKKSKFRLSNPFSSKPSKEEPITQDHGPENKNNANNTTISTLNAPSGDSAYGSSEAMNTTPGSSAGQVPTVTEAQAQAQDAPMKTQTDRATGRTITTTTTTTTTTVTTTDGDHIQVPPGQEVVVEQNEDNTAVPSSNNEPTELSARPISRDSRENLNRPTEPGPPIPPKDNRRSHSPAVQPTASSSVYSNTNTYDPAAAPVSPEDPRPPNHNFSYPSRTPPANSAQPLHYRNGSGYHAYAPPAAQRYPSGDTLRPPDSAGIVLPPPQTQTYGYGREPEQLRPDGTPSTLSNLKTAAAGIHGASEALRGALNSSLERHTGGDPRAIAAHDSTAAKGRREIETGRFFRERSSQSVGSAAGAGAANRLSGTSPTSPQFIRDANNPPAPSPAPTPTMAGGSYPAVGYGTGTSGGYGTGGGYSVPGQAQGLNGVQQSQGGPVEGVGVEESGNGHGKVKRKGLKNVLKKKE